MFELDSEANKSSNSAKLLSVSRPHPLRPSEVWNVKSPNNLYNAIITNWKDNSEEKQFIEVINIFFLANIEFNRNEKKT